MALYNPGLGIRHRVVVVVPMAALGLVDGLVALLTLGFIQPSLALRWAFRHYK